MLRTGRTIRIGKGYTATAGAVAALLACCAPAQAQTAAGVAIPNIARASFAIDGTPSEVTSAPAIVRIAERLDIALSARTSTIAALATGTTPIAFTVANGGNGLEAFDLTAACENGRVVGFAIDSDGDGVFDPARDTVLADAKTPRLNPGGTQPLFVLIDQVTGETRLSVQARANTASGNPGTLSAGRGDEGVDAIVGPTTATATLQFSITPGSSAQATLEKSQSVVNRDGGDVPMAHSVVTYSLVARFTGGTARDAVISDPIPADTRYLPGSLTIDGATMSDAADADAGSFDGQAIRAELGTVAGPAERTVTFKVIIQ
jgi:uncharacterized repeat protein (TIGR01451 family)